MFIRLGLVAKLLLVLTLIASLSYLSLFYIFYQSANTVFREVQIEGAGLDMQPSIPQALQTKLDAAAASENINGMVSLLSNAEFAEPGVDWLLISPDLSVLGGMPERLKNALVNQADNSALQIKVYDNNDSTKSALDLITNQYYSFASESGAIIAYVVLLPAVNEAVQANQFSKRIYQKAGLALMAVILVSALMILWIVRRNLSPLNVLTHAANKLAKGDFVKVPASQATPELLPLFEAYNQAVKALENTENMRKQLVADIGHELRTPLTNIDSHLQAVQMGLTTPDNEWVKRMLSECQLLQRLSEDFQQLTLTDSGQMVLKPTAISLDNVLQELQQTSAADDVDWDIQVPVDCLIWVDPARTHQVLLNLLDNARRHRPRDLRIKLVSERVGARVRLLFHDNGPGIHPDDQAFIFDRFYRAEKSRNRHTGGSGLGLAIAKGLMKAMGGDITLVASDKGACFRLTFIAPNDD